jgi:membrane-bound lytic murein transglycosylase B
MCGALKARSMLLAGCMTVLLGQYAVAQSDGFATWMRALRAEARQLGISERTLEAALTGVQPLPRVIELDRKQPEVTLTYTQYIQRVLPPARIQQGKHLRSLHRALLTKIGAAYGVQPSIIVALWGLESDYGQVTGNFQVIPALATLAYDGRRSALFRRELLEALKILDEAHVSPKAMVGSWAGAMGQNQFMPSSFRQFAVDYDGDGRRDIWTTLADIFASTAHYLSRSGWRNDEGWGCPVTMSTRVDATATGPEVRKPLAAWQALGLRQVNCRTPQNPAQPAALILPEGPEGPAFLVYNNYHTLLKWNRSINFALAAGQLADALEDSE